MRSKFDRTFGVMIVVGNRGKSRSAWDGFIRAAATSLAPVPFGRPRRRRRLSKAKKGRGLWWAMKMDPSHKTDRISKVMMMILEEGRGGGKHVDEGAPVSIDILLLLLYKIGCGMCQSGNWIVSGYVVVYVTRRLSYGLRTPPIFFLFFTTIFFYDVRHHDNHWRSRRRRIQTTAIRCVGRFFYFLVLSHYYYTARSLWPVSPTGLFGQLCPCCSFNPPLSQSHRILSSRPTFWYV